VRKKKEGGKRGLNFQPSHGREKGGRKRKEGKAELPPSKMSTQKKKKFKTKNHPNFWKGRKRGWPPLWPTVKKGDLSLRRGGEGKRCRPLVGWKGKREEKDMRQQRAPTGEGKNF